MSLVLAVGQSLYWWYSMAGRTHLPLCPLQGGISDELSLSAYVTAAMLELGLSPTVRMTPFSLAEPLGWGRLLLATPGCCWSHRA